MVFDFSSPEEVREIIDSQEDESSSGIFGGSSSRSSSGSSGSSGGSSGSSGWSGTMEDPDDFDESAGPLVDPHDAHSGSISGQSTTTSASSGSRTTAQPEDDPIVEQAGTGFAATQLARQLADEAGIDFASIGDEEIGDVWDAQIEALIAQQDAEQIEHPTEIAAIMAPGGGGLGIGAILLFTVTVVSVLLIGGSR